MSARPPSAIRRPTVPGRYTRQPVSPALTQPLLLGVFLKLAENKGARPRCPRVCGKLVL